MLVSCGDPVEPAAEAGQRASGAEDVPDPVQQPSPAAQRPGVGEMGDRLLHQRPQPRLLPVVGPLGVGEGIHQEHLVPGRQVLHPERFAERRDAVSALGFDDVFHRMWELYLSYSEAGFKSGYLDVYQWTFAPTGSAR